MIGPAAGEPDTGRAAPSRTGLLDAAGGIASLLAIGLALRLIIAYLLPGSGFEVDLASFRYWASNLADEGLFGFYQRDFFHDYTPGYLYVLWLVGGVANLFGGGIGDLIKIPPIVADLAIGYLVWSMVRELGGSERSARIGALIAIFNPVTWFDSVIWGQVDSFGVVFLLLGLRELWRDRPERAAIFATVAALIKPQLGILIPIVAFVVIRRALWPEGGYGAEGLPERVRGTLDIERRIRGPIRIFTTGGVAIATAFLACLPFGLQFPFGLIAQIFKTAGGYPYLTVNAFNPWALYIHKAADGGEQSLALGRSWVCDSTIVPTGPSEFRLGPFVIPELGSPGSALSCPDGAMIGAFPAVAVGAVLFLIAAAIVCWVVARRPDRWTMTVGLAVLALAFFMLPTRVHERYLFPLMAVAAIPAAVALRWRLAYLLSAASMFANMYVVLVVYYPNNPQIRDWLGIGPMLAEPWWITIAVAAQVAVFAWVFFQLREEAVEGLVEAADTAGWVEQAAPPALEPRPALPAPIGPFAASGNLSAAAAVPARPSAAGTGVVVAPAWERDRDVPALGPVAWFRARLADPPFRADRSRELNRERGGRVDRLDVWILALLAISLLTVRMWRLDEPYEMHFDEVYHPRTATEFLQDWRYGLPHNIYEWTHPHLAKYAMAAGLVAFGEDKVSGTSDLGVAVVDAAIETRRDDGLDQSRRLGDRLWVATGSELRAYDLGTRDLAATASLDGAVAVAYDDRNHWLYVGLRSGEIRVVDTESVDATRGRGVLVDPDVRAFVTLDGPIEDLFLSRDEDVLVATLQGVAAPEDPTASTLVVLDADAAVEIARPVLRGVNQVGDSQSGRILVATDEGLAVIDPTLGEVTEVLDVGGRAMGVVGINDISDDPIYVPVQSIDGPQVVKVIAKGSESPRIDKTFTLPGETAGRAYFDLAARMVHVEGSTPASDGQPSQPTVYVIEPHADAVYADARLPFAPAVMAMDENQEYPSSDRQQLLAFDQGGRVASVEVGRHAYAWRVPGVVAGVLMALFLYVLARLLFRRRTVAVLAGLIVLLDGMLFVQSRIGMNDSYVGLGIVGAYTVFAALWLNPGSSRRHWLAFLFGIPIVGLFLGFALAAKWVAAFAIGGLGLLVLSRSALGRALLIAGLVVLTTALGYVAISVPEGQSGGNYLFLAIMIALVIAAVIVNVVHPIAWTWEEARIAAGAPAVVGALAFAYGLARGDAAGEVPIGPFSFTPVEIGMLGLLAAAGIWVGFMLLGRWGFGPLAAPPEPWDPGAVLDPPAEPPRSWLNLGSAWGFSAVWLGVGLLVIPLGLYVLSYLPWAFVDNYRLWEGFPAENTGQTLLQLTSAMYGYHNNLTSPHAASSPWWAWPLDLKPVWFYEEGLAGGTAASIYDAGNLVAWWLAVPAMAFVAWQAFRRRSVALALIVFAFAAQWLQWARIDRAAFQYHYYTALPFLFLALAYFLAELWHGTSRRIWLLARLSAGAAVLLPFALWVLHRPLCAIAGVDRVNEGSRACPTLIPEVSVSPRAVALAIIMGVGVLLLLRELLAVTEEDEPAELRDERAAGGWRGALARVGLGGRWATAALIAVGTGLAFFLTNSLLGDVGGFPIANIPVEPIALLVLVALTPVAAYVATARDARRFVIGAVTAMVFWFVLWYPNISGLPLPSNVHNAYQGFLPTYIYDFQFAVNNQAASAPSLFALGPAVMLLSIAAMAVAVGYSAWSWRIALAERRRDQLAAEREPPTYAARAD